MSANLDSLRDKIVNAVWMLRRGKLSLFARSLWLELSMRYYQFKVLLERLLGLDLGRAEGSVFSNPRKVIPSSPRPTVFTLPAAELPGFDHDAVANELADIVNSLPALDATPDE